MGNCSDSFQIKIIGEDLFYTNLIIRLVVVGIGLALTLGMFDELNENKLTVVMLGIVVMLFGIYRIIILYSKRNRYNLEKNENLGE